MVSAANVQKKKMQNKKIRRLTLAILLYVLIGFLSLLTFETFHIHHDCFGETCPICFLMKVVKAELTSFIKIAFISTVFVNALTILLSDKITLSFIKSITPVSQKVRIND